MNGYSDNDIWDFINAEVKPEPLPPDVLKEERNDSFFSQLAYHDSGPRTASISCVPQTTRPEVLLFKDGTGVTINDTAEHLGDSYANKETLFLRDTGGGNSKASLIQILDKDRNLKIFTPEAACSEFEKVARICVLKKNEFIHAILKTADTARILSCDVFISKLPLIKIVTRCPVIIETSNGETKIINRYDRDSGIFGTGPMPPDVSIDEAVELILSSIEEFDFMSPADKSRAIANIITPALIMGGIENFRSPIDYTEADDSQTGKGFKTKITAAYYNEIPYPINQQSGGGVGSLEESFNQAVIEGRIFINLDNLKPTKDGVFDSMKICSFMTEDRYFARMLRTAMYVDPRKHIIQVTTNGCSLSKDLMNRCSPVSIQKRHGYTFKKYPEGSILDHIRKNQPRYLGAVFSIVKEWVKLGKPRTSTTVHESSFTPWAQCLDWIVQHIMGQAPLLEGYEQVRDRVTSPYLQMLRDIALAVVKYRNDESLTASDIMEEVGHEGVLLPGMKTDCDFDKLTPNEKDTVRKQFGIQFGRAFKYHGHDDVLDLNGIKITRRVMPTTYQGGTTKDLKYYIFSKQGDIQ